MNKDLTGFLQNEVPLFKKVSPGKIQELLKGSRVASFEAKEAVIECGEEGRFLGVLVEGEAEVSFADEAGVRHRAATLKPGDIFGEMSLMTGDKTTADVIALARCTALLIPQGLFSAMLAAHPPAIQFLSRLISSRAKKMGAHETDRKLAAAAAFRKSDDPYGFGLKTDQPMKVLVLDAGPASLTYHLFDTVDERQSIRGTVEKGIDTPAEALEAVLKRLTAPETVALRTPQDITAVGHRVTHGGETFAGPALITEDVLKEIEALSALSPRDNPAAVAGIRAARTLFPDVPHVAVFDTAFHHTLPPYSYLYALPLELYEQKKIRRYGFHGLSHHYAALKAAQFLKRPFGELEIISCHLAKSASLCAIDHGRSVDTSAGFSPADGLIMGTSCGDIDPGALTHLLTRAGMPADALDKLLHEQSGLLGLSGLSDDMAMIETAAQEGNPRALLAFKTFCYRIRKYIGAYGAAMHGLDVVVFTGDIGLASAGVRSLACQDLACIGIQIDEEKNRRAGEAGGISDISTADARVRTLVIPADEERMIARETIRTLDLAQVSRIIKSQKPAPVPIEISAHHVHLSAEHVEALFGPGHQLTRESDLSQPGQYACKEKVNLIGPRGRIERVRVLGPVRKATQVEIAMTEQFKLGIHPPIRESGDIEGTPGITLEGPNGTTLTIDKGVVCALRHVHMSPEDALRFGLKDKNKVRVRVAGGDRELIYGDVLVRVHPNFKLSMHLDTDEGNAAGVATGMTGTIDGIQTQE